jgi:DNA repair exonuclease SbcCD ATPase subunit
MRLSKLENDRAAIEGELVDTKRALEQTKAELVSANSELQSLKDDLEASIQSELKLAQQLKTAADEVDLLRGYLEQIASKTILLQSSSDSIRQQIEELVATLRQYAPGADPSAAPEVPGKDSGERAIPRSSETADLGK